MAGVTEVVRMPNGDSREPDAVEDVHEADGGEPQEQGPDEQLDVAGVLPMMTEDELERREQEISGTRKPAGPVLEAGDDEVSTFAASEAGEAEEVDPIDPDELEA